ncbi:MAG: lipocalin-like domain-containing protein [Proteobacteria bacterium]|uniref:lipocalin-like domain-containing protein n=1 Tax=Rudaea sp. TaxID=2136325 RepID=UPI001E0E019B|nr:lipocalin-like domain-containing protein [Pseudomonadota bacterium]
MNFEPAVRAMPRLRSLWLISLCIFAISQSSFAKPPLAVNDAAHFIGTWELVSVVAAWPDGHATNPWGDHPPGRLIYTKDGRMLVLCMHEFRNEAARSVIPPELQNEAAGYFGTYKVDSDRHVVSHAIVATLRPSESGTIDRTYEFKDGELYLRAKATRDGLPVTYVLVWKRA